MIRALAVLVAALGLAGAAAAEDQVIKDSKGLCQISVPADWKPNKLIHSMTASPDEKNSSVVSAPRAGADYQMLVDVAKSTYSVTKTVEASGDRTIFVYSNRTGKPGGGVYVMKGGAQMCNATVDYSDPGFEATAINIVKTVKTAK